MNEDLSVNLFIMRTFDVFFLWNFTFTEQIYSSVTTVVEKNLPTCTLFEDLEVSLCYVLS